jgi:hypothetical protein
MPLVRLQIADHIAVVTMDCFEQNLVVQLKGTEDSRGAMRASIEKRKPVFKGK